ncbi:Flavin-containing monooxygenase FMO GS-OX3 [Chionoecetes opilio]|uniref:Flavin-containing monooxygenase n=1 Tax=Chionoecetes opilio TaxID=41210 RepID=A0A8J4XLL2_CHIOP|nr:Flavin-containing monooxygenase FMO GS-OX3 [Chionoecetes opilio]
MVRGGQGMVPWGGGKVFLSHNFPLMIPSELPANLHQVRPVVSADERGFVLTDGRHIEADAIIYCTVQLSFLTASCGIEVKDNHVQDLYKHIVNIRHPSMGFIGLPSRVVVFLVIHYQVQYFLATLRGKATLPTFEEMLAITHKTNQEREKQGLPQKHYHTLATTQFEYLADIAREAKLEDLPNFKPRLLTIVLLRLFFSFPVFKNYRYYMYY